MLSDDLEAAIAGLQLESATLWNSAISASASGETAAFDTAVAVMPREAAYLSIIWPSSCSADYNLDEWRVTRHNCWLFVELLHSWRRPQPDRGHYRSGRRDRVGVYFQMLISAKAGPSVQIHHPHHEFCSTIELSRLELSSINRLMRYVIS